MTEAECEQALVNFQPLLSFLVSDFEKDAVSKYYIPPKIHVEEGGEGDLHTVISEWLDSPMPRPIAIWAGYGMGKTTYARYLSSVLAHKCTKEYGAPIPILLNLGEFTTAPNIENLIVSQLANHYGVRDISSAAFRILNEQRRFVLILDGFDEMKFAMAPNEFSHISAQIRRTAVTNPRLILLGRPSAIENEDEKDRLTSSQIKLHDIAVKADDGPDFMSFRLAPLSRDEYLLLIRSLLNSITDRAPGARTVQETMAAVESLDLGDILGRPVQAKMLAEVVADSSADIKSISRFSLYSLFIKRILRREEEKSVRRHLGSDERTHFMRLLAWWLWTVKKTRTFIANEIPEDIIQKFQMPGVPTAGLRRELLIGSVLEEKNIGYFLAEKDAGVFYFPHTSFTEFLVADYIMSNDFLSPDVTKLPDALYGEVPTFLKEHPSKKALATVYERMKAAGIGMNTQCISVLLNDFDIMLRIEVLRLAEASPWDVCMHYIFLLASHKPREAKLFLFKALESGDPLIQLSAMYCLVYEDVLSPGGIGAATGVTHLLWHLFSSMGLPHLSAATQRSEITVPSRQQNHIGELITHCVKFSRGESVIFDFSEFSAVALKYFGNACVVSDVVDRVQTSTIVPGNNLRFLAKTVEERDVLSHILRHEGSLKFIPLM